MGSWFWLPWFLAFWGGVVWGVARGVSSRRGLAFVLVVFFRCTPIKGAGGESENWFLPD